MRLCFILPGETYSSHFLMVWTDLILKCAQRGHQVMVAQKPTRAECFAVCAGETFDAYMCIDPNVVFSPDDVFKMIESPHDVTGAMMMSSDFQTLTCGRSMESLVPTAEQYVVVDTVEPSWMLLHSIPADWNFTSPLAGHVDTSMRVGNRQLVTL